MEELAKLKADGEGKYEYIRAESEFAAISIVEGSLAAGVRSYTATSSQGLLLMTEMIYNVAGMRLPLVMTCANRAVSAPINIWNDQQDAVTMRDSGWLMWFGETNQEVCDLHILAYKVAEKLQLPVMVNLDGFVLTHVVEPTEIETPEKIKKFLPDYKPTEFLDVNNPLTFGAFATPTHYFEIRQELHEDVVNAKKEIIKSIGEFKKIFGRDLNLIEYYGDKNADTIIVAMGSILGTIKDAVDELNNSSQSAQGGPNRKIGVLKIVSLRPWPKEEILSAIANAKNIAVIDKSISLGKEGVLASEIKSIAVDNKNITSFIVGLGGRDITIPMIKKIYLAAKNKNKEAVFVGK